MHKKNGIKEIAQLAGVSIATVSRILNGKGSVSPDIEKRVVDLANELGYRPSPAARYMRSKKSGLLGIVVPELSVPYFSNIVNGAIDKATEFGQMVVVATGRGSESKEKDCLKRFSHYMLDGLIYCPIGTGDFVLEINLQEQLPLVVAGRRKVIESVPHINTNDEKAGYIATRYLLGLGRRNIGFFAGFWDVVPFSSEIELIEAIDSPVSGAFSTLDRLRGYRKALRENNLEINETNLVFSKFDADSGYKSSKELFGRLGELDAVIVPNCYVARGVYEFCREQGIEIPERLSLISMDDVETGELLSPPTTSIVHDMYSVGRESVTVLNEILNKQDAKDILIDVKLNIRQSTTMKL